jgi:hypothetical protein
MRLRVSTVVGLRSRAILIFVGAALSVPGSLTRRGNWKKVSEYFPVTATSMGRRRCVMDLSFADPIRFLQAR